MQTFVLRANRDINDIKTGELHEQGTDFEISEIVPPADLFLNYCYLFVGGFLFAF